ncbi:aldo/keto reductase [Flaviaesturariibacter flavus]|uniref:aldo/keto reductase n=1 Tax=Flaviaesturariibacter flavus TaxID=2502780 RepID=UPI0021CE1140|nr:aldo/keto reductase [Flaviaesturariibacter flavus]
MGMSDMYGSKESRNDNESIETVRAALEMGINFLDTGDYYGMGHNELLIQEALKGRSEKPVISVKFGALRSPAGDWLGFDTRPEAVKTFAAYSLNRLGVDAIDIYQPGRVHPAIPIEDTVGAIADLIQQGKVKYIGLSEASPDIIRRAHKVHPITAIEVEYSLASRVIEKELLSVCRELGIGIVAYGVLSRGLLSGELTGQFAPSDFRAHAPRFSGENFEENKRKVSQLQELARQKGCTPSQLALAWVLHQGSDILPLFGTTKKSRLQENIHAADIVLTKEELDWLDKTFPEGSFAGTRYAAPQMGMVVN